jgi:hypothetical protein
VTIEANTAHERRRDARCGLPAAWRNAAAARSAMRATHAVAARSAMRATHAAAARSVVRATLAAAARSVVRATPLCLLLAVLGAAPAAAAPAWLGPVGLSTTTRDAYAPQVAVDPRGNAVAVWRRSSATGDRVQSSTRAAGGDWQAPVDLSAPGAIGFDPQVAVDPHGDAVAVWQRYDDADNLIVQGTARPAGGAWQPPVDLSAAGQNAVGVQVALDALGNAVAVWQRFDGADDVAQSATRPAGGSWQAPADLSAAGQPAAAAQVAFDARGNAVAVWQRFDGANDVVQSATRTAGGAWATPVDLSAPGHSALRAQLAVDPQGDAVAIWQRHDGTHYVVQAAARPAGGVWQPPDDLSAAQNAADPQVAVDPRGNAVAVWNRDSTGGRHVVQGATRAADSDWQTPVDLSVSGRDATSAQVGVDPRGNAIALWQRHDGASYVVQGAVRPSGAIWQAPVDLSAVGRDAADPQLAIDPQGNATAVWWRSDGTHDIVQAAGYDAAGPLLDALSVPTAGTVGQPLSLSVSPLDVWSALGATSWTFGDGATATGTSLTHAYADAGTFAVGVTATDAISNATSATRTITIEAPPPPPPPPPVAPPPPPPRPIPAITGLRLSPRAFRAAASGASVKTAAARTGTRVSYALDVPASVRFTVTRSSRGRSVGGHCVAATARNRGHGACTLLTSMRGGFGRRRSAGSDRFTFTGRLAGSALKPGRYSLQATPTAGGRTGRPARIAFRVVS